MNAFNPSPTWSRERDSHSRPARTRFRVLALESPDSEDTLVAALNTGSYEIDHVTSILDAEQHLGRTRHDLVILEIALPGNPEAGIGLLHGLRAAHSHTPVVLIGRSALLSDRVAALDAGSDDYLVRPLVLEEVRVRVRAALRRTNPRLAYNIAQSDVHLDWAARTARVSDRIVPLTAHEFDLLEALASKPGQALSSRELAESRASEAGRVPAFVTSIRRKLGAHVIETVRGRGYRLGLI